MVIDTNIIMRDYNKLKKLTKRSFDKAKYEDACLFMKKAALLMYNSNIIYTDDDFEFMIDKISAKIIKSRKFTPNKIRIVFYDYFVIDNRGLTEQYLDSLINSNYEFFFIGCQQSKQSKEIYSKLKKYNIPFCVISDKNEIERASHITTEIDKFSPSIVIAHTSPWDIAGLLAINSFKEKCKRFLINITDHAFWLGKSSFDYFFEFRDYGFNISRLYRKIEEEKLLKAPYYPIINNFIPFEGFDFDTSNKKIIFSGGSIYKIQGSSVFLEIVKYILDNYRDTVFLFLGSGDSNVFNKFVMENNYETRFFYRPERKDIYEVFKRCYFYLNTYPLIGGLMTQYACIAGKLPLTLNDNNDACNDIEELLLNTNEVRLQFSNIDDMKKSIDLYLSKPDVLFSDSDKLNDVIISKEKFRSLIGKYLENQKTQIKFSKYEIDIDKFKDQYISRFNEDNCTTYYRLFMSRNIKMLVNFPFYYFMCFFNKIKSK